MKPRTLCLDGPNGEEIALRYTARLLDCGEWDIAFVDPIPEGMDEDELAYNAAEEADEAYHRERMADYWGEVDRAIDDYRMGGA